MRNILAVLCLLVMGSYATAEPDTKHLQNIIGTVKIKSVKPSEIQGLYEVYIDGMGVPFYLSSDGQYLIEGQVTDLISKKNLTEAKINVARKELIAGIPESDMIIYKQPDAKHTVTIFTDVDCGYCRKLHSELNSYFKEGIAIRYVAFPAIAKQDKMESVWCAKDPQVALTMAKKGESVAKASCGEHNPVKKQYEIGLSIGVTGTPNMILEDGTMVGGYVPAKELIKMIERK